MPSIVPGLAHSSGSPQGPACEICLWDSESTGVAPVPPPRPLEDLTGRCGVWGFKSARYRFVYRWGEGSVSAMDCRERQAVYWLPSCRDVPVWVSGAPLRGILDWWMELNGRQLVHAAAVGYGGRGVLIPGRSGSGKSSTALACLEHGLDFVSDDYVALALDPEPRAFRLYATAKLNPGSLELYPGIAKRFRMMHDDQFDKMVLCLEDHLSSQLRESLPIEQVLKPTVRGAGETALAPIDPRESRALGLETVAHLLHMGPSNAEFLERISQELPCATLLLGPDRPGIARAIRDALTRPPGVRPPREVPATRPYISLVVHLRQPGDRDLHALASAIEAHGYPRTELMVTACGAVRDLAPKVSGLPGIVHFLPFDDQVSPAVAWNRAIREAFADFVFFMESEDRLVDGSLEALADCAAAAPGTAWFRGEAGRRSLRGALVRKSAFERCGLFDTNPLLEGREQQEWIARVARLGLIGLETGIVSLHAGSNVSGPGSASVKTPLREIKAAIDRRRKAAESA